MLQYEPDMDVVGEAANGREALEQYRLDRPDVVLMDLRMPEMDGAEATAAILAEFPAARIILISGYDGDEEVYRGLRAGSRAYLVKDVPCEEILDTIRGVHTGKKRITLSAGAKLAERMEHPELTEREQGVLQLMVAGQSNQEIAAALFISVGTVKFHVNHIFSKLGVNDRTQAVIAALKHGMATLD
jgi:DNA-binding NarL/FixJ family response regulator